MRAPGPSFERCTVRGGRPADLDWARAASQHAALARRLELIGVDVEILPPLDDFPDSVFVEDTAVIVDRAATLCPFVTPARVGEETGIASALERELQISRLSVGALDGGDCIVTEDELWVGLSGRSSEEAARALAALHPSRRLRTLPIPSDVLHLKCAASHLGRGTFLVAQHLLGAAAFRGHRVLEAPPDEEDATNCLALGRDVIVAAGHPRTAELLDREGYRVHAIDISELAKGDGSVTCLSLVWPRVR